MMLNPQLLSVIPEGIIPTAGPLSQRREISISPLERCEHGSHDKLSKTLIACIHAGKPASEIVECLLLVDERMNESLSYFICPSRSEWKTQDRYINCLAFVLQGFQYQWRQGVTISPEGASQVDTSDVFNISEFEDQKKFPEPIPIVNGLIHKAELLILSATAKTGKSWFALDLAFSVVSGADFLNHFPVIKSKVFVLQTEVGNAQLRKRIIKVFGSDLKKYDSKVFFSNERVKLDTTEGFSRLKNFIKSYGPELLILDPFYTLHNSSEDSSSEIAPILSDLRGLAQSENISILLIHHQGKKKEGTPQAGHRHRGSSSFADVPDGSLSLSPHGLIGNMLTLDFEMRNVEAPPRMDLERDNETMRCSYMGEAKKEERFPLEGFLEALGEFKDLSATELKDELAKRFNSSPRTISNKLRELVKAKRIKSIKKGKFTNYIIEEVKNEE